MKLFCIQLTEASQIRQMDRLLDVPLSLKTMNKTFQDNQSTLYRDYLHVYKFVSSTMCFVQWIIGLKVPWAIYL